MRAANFAWLPETFSAMAMATSLADLVGSARMASSTRTVEPARTPSLEGAWAAALADTVSRLSRVSRFACSSSKRT